MMQTIYQARPGLWQRAFAAALAVLGLVAGVLPELHHHVGEAAVEARCLDSGLTTSAHLETPEPAHHEACGRCAKTSWFAGPERPQATLAGEHVAERAREGSGIVPPGPPGRHGASRAPPLA
ncbi:MAG: hypothetical protein MI919_14355 [Holophagales bacterium]|nr:hypothetical protein [Holophagales bacterium]